MGAPRQFTEPVHHAMRGHHALDVRRTRAGDAWGKRNAAEAAKPAGVMLGLPKIGVPEPLPAATGGCVAH